MSERPNGHEQQDLPKIEESQSILLEKGYAAVGVSGLSENTQ
jgi:hypothetical protein